MRLLPPRRVGVVGLDEVVLPLVVVGGRAAVGPREPGGAVVPGDLATVVRHAAGLEERTGLPTGYRDSGALIVATDRDDAEALRRLHEFQLSLGLDVEWLPPGACRRLEPGLSPRIAGGIHAHGDGQADPRATVRALAEVVGEIELGVEVEAIEHEHGRVTGVRTSAGVVQSDAVVVAAGAWSPALAPDSSGPPVRPVKGQILELRVRAGMQEPIARVVRTPRCYLVARGDGRVVLGATMEEQGFDTAVTADGVYRLRIVTQDVAGNSAASAAVTNVRIDNTVPTTSQDDPGQYLRATKTLTGSAADSA